MRRRADPGPRAGPRRFRHGRGPVHGRARGAPGPGANFAAVDLFEADHARKVLSLLGEAYGRLFRDPAQQTPDQSEFLDQAVAGLARTGRVSPVQLSVLVETIKDRPWTRATLKKIGAIDGIGVEFLERSLGARSTNPEYRRYAAAARAVLATLLPGRDGGLKGRRRTLGELRVAAGHADDPEGFAALIRILDSEMKLITAVDDEGPDAPGRAAGRPRLASRRASARRGRPAHVPHRRLRSRRPPTMAVIPWPRSPYRRAPRRRNGPTRRSRKGGVRINWHMTTSSRR